MPLYERQTKTVPLLGSDRLTSANVEALTEVFDTSEQVLPALHQEPLCRSKARWPSLEGTRCEAAQSHVRNAAITSPVNARVH